jgi:hypothetical protein
MAVDEAIAAHAGRGEVSPTLRFYRWQPACVSLGRHQPLAEAFSLAARAGGAVSSRGHQAADLVPGQAQQIGDVHNDNTNYSCHRKYL